jgi:hypothetical protein
VPFLYKAHLEDPGRQWSDQIEGVLAGASGDLIAASAANLLRPESVQEILSKRISAVSRGAQ